MNSRLVFVLSLLAVGAVALCQKQATGEVPSTPGPAAIIPFLGGLMMNLRRRKK